MKPQLRLSLTFWLVLCGCIPAYANNPPAPDGMLSLVMIFPVAILGLRFAGARLPAQSRKWRILKGLGLGLATFLTAGGTEIAMIPLVILLVYGLWRGTQAIQLGRGGKRFAAGGAVMLFTLFAMANYVASTMTYRGTTATESSAVGAVRTINTAEEQFRSDRTLDTNKNGAGEYGTFDQLRKAGLLDDNFLSSASGRSYQLVLVLNGDPSRDEKEYFLYATPKNYGEPPWTLSLLAILRRPPRLGRQTFASDETGVIRARDLGTSRPVTRKEAQSWGPL